MVSSAAVVAVRKRKSTGGGGAVDKSGVLGQEVNIASKDHVFISHAEEDKSVAVDIAKGLEDAGYKTWYYERDSIPGKSYIMVSSQAIEQSKAVVLIISRDSLRSNQVHTEVVTAHEAEKTFIPILSGVSHIEFQQTRPEWRRILGTATSVTLPREGVPAILGRIIAGLTNTTPNTEK